MEITTELSMSKLPTLQAELLQEFIQVVDDNLPAAYRWALR